ncbi:NADAR family protein [Clostridium perfringens]|uniref:NADAR family protein n=1 Tax=Clostridium perfringens TaxID=1502 RepID=A0A6G4ZE82_CLOPF|nr:NADAR family protein [Clostridium perfringens]
MYLVVKEKFKPNKELRRKLIATGDKYLEEGNTWNDTYLGVCKGKGRNMLGKILMRVRSEIINIE